MRRRFVGLEPLEQRCLLSATVFENHDIGYFLNQNNHRLERYDIAQEAWLAPIDLSGTAGKPTAALVDDDGIYVAYDAAVYRYNLNGSGQTHLLNAQSTVNAIHSDGNLLFINYSSGLYARFKSINKTIKTIVDTFEYYVDSVFGSSIAPEANRIFGRSQGVSPSDITYVAYNDAGTFSGGANSPYHGTFPDASKTWVFPGDGKVVDNSGTIYSTSGLTRLNTFGSSIDDIDFLGTNVPIILQGSTLTAYTPSILPAGSITLNYKPAEIFVNSTDVITFTPDANQATGFRADIVPLSRLNAPIPGQPVNPVGLPYTPDKVEMAADGTVLLYSKSHQSIFRWNPATRSYTASIPLTGTAEYMAYSSQTNTVYLGYESGLIRKLDLNAAQPVEKPFAVLTGGILGLSTAGKYVFAADDTGNWCTNYTFAPDGTLLDSVESDYYSKECIWSDANQKMYFFHDDVSPNGLSWKEINANGTAYPAEPVGGIGHQLSAQVHDSIGFVPPIRIAPDGGVVVLGSGMIFNAATLSRLPMALANSIEDATWLSGELFTVRNVSGLAEFQHWSSSSYNLRQSTLKSGTALSILTLADGHLLGILIDNNGIPVFREINENLEDLSFTAGFTVQETLEETSVDESGTSDTLEVVLKTQPTTNVVITVSSGDTSEVSLSPTLLTFTPENWNTPQVVTVSGVDDIIVDGSQTTLVQFSINDAASDKGFIDASDQFIPVNTLDNETLVSSVWEHNGIGYFFIQSTPRVERYDIVQESWLAPISLSGATGTPTAGLVDDEGIYAAYGNSVYRYNLDGTGQTHLLNAQSTVYAIHSDGNLLFINYSQGLNARIISINKSTNTIVDMIENYVWSLSGSSIAPESNRIFGRSQGVNPPDITYVAYNDDGTFCGGGDSPYHGTFPNALRTWVFPGDAKVVDDSGTIYSTSGLMRLNSLGSSIKDIDFLGTDVPIILNGNTLTAYSPGILPTGSVTLNYTPSEIFINATDIITFTVDASLATGLRADIVSLSQLKAPLPGQPVDPVGLPYTPDKVEMAADGTVLLYSKSNQSIFRWDPITESYTASIPLIGPAIFTAYSSQTNTVYLAYESGLIRKLDLNAAQPVEEPFAILPNKPLGLSTAGPYLFAVDMSEPWVTHYTFAPDGTLIDSVDWNEYSTEFVWSDVNQKMYLFRDGTSPNDLLTEEINADGTAYPAEPVGGIGHKIDSPLHNGTGFLHPIRVAPDGNIVVLGSGVIHNAVTLERLPVALANSIEDATWLGGELITARNSAGITELQHWSNTTFELIESLKLPGTLNSLFTIDAKHLLGVTVNNEGVPIFSVINVTQGLVTATDNSYTVSENQILTGNLISDDTGGGADGTTVASAVLQVVAVNGNRNNVGVPLVLESGAILTVQADGSFRYQPGNSIQFDDLMPGEPFVESFQYTTAQFMSSPDSGSIATVTMHIMQASWAPSGTSTTINISPIAPYTFKAADFGFSDPNDSPSDSFVGVKITTLPTAGSLTLSSNPVAAGQFVPIADIEAGNLSYRFDPPTSGLGSNYSFTFQVEDSGSIDNGGETIDPTPNTLTLHVLPYPRLSISNRTATEGDNGTKIFTFTVSITDALDFEVRVNFATSDGLAIAGEDYVSTNGVLVWSPGDTTNKTISVTINGDMTLELDEVFFVHLSNPVNAILSTSVGIGKIVNDDQPRATVVTPPSPQVSNTVKFHYTLFDNQSDPCNILVEFQVNGRDWQTAIQAPGGEGTTGLAASPSGVEHTFIWQDTLAWTADMSMKTVSLKYRIIPSDASSVGLPATSDPVTYIKNPDYSPPTPNSSTWVERPHATDSTSIRMTATTASDYNGVQYYFHCLTPGGHDSGWQSSAIYVDKGLSPDTAYTYAVKTRDQLTTPNEGIYSVPAVATTFAYEPLVIRGSTNNDVFEFHADNTAAKWLLFINGVLQEIPTDIKCVLIDGLSGEDRLSFEESTAELIAELSYVNGTFLFGGNTLGYTNLEHLTVTGASDNDTVTLYDSVANDVFEGLPESARLTASGKSIELKKFHHVAVNSTAGNDTGVIFGSQDGPSSYVAGPAGVNFAGPGFNYTASGFKALSAYAAPGKANTAVFNSTDGRELLIASYLGAQFIGQGFAYDVWNVPNITGNAGAGDEARFYGAPGGNTNLTVSPDQAVQSEPGYTLKGVGYSKFSSYVYPDGNTTATITGSSGADHAVTSPLGAQLTNPNLNLSAWTYKHINLVGNGGNDAGDMYGSDGVDSFTGNGPVATMNAAGTDRSITGFAHVTAHGTVADAANFFAKQGMTNTFDAGSTQAAMSGSGYKNIAVGFGADTAYAIPGGTDVANYTDSTGTDYFISSYLGSQMFGKGYSNAGWNFAVMNATSSAGADAARFYGSPTSADSFVGTPTDAKHSGAGYASEAKNFARVEAFAGLNTGGTAQLTGSAGDDHYTGSPLGAQLWGANYHLEAWNFARVNSEGAGGNDVANMYGNASNNQLAADNVFAEFSGAGFANRVDHFATTAIHGSATGSDTATLDHAYLETGAMDTPENDLGHTVTRKLWLYDMDEITTTEKPTQPTPQPKPVDKVMTAFMYE